MTSPESSRIALRIGSAEGDLVGGEAFEGPGALHDGYKYFMDKVDKHGGWIVRATCSRDFDNHLEGLITLWIGPLHYRENPLPDSPESEKPSLQ